MLISLRIVRGISHGRKVAIGPDEAGSGVTPAFRAWALLRHCLQRQNREIESRFVLRKRAKGTEGDSQMRRMGISGKVKEGIVARCGDVSEGRKVTCKEQ